MTNEPVDTGPKDAVSSGGAEPHEDQVASDELAALWAILLPYSFDPEVYALGTALAIYSKAFVEALAKRHADGLTDRLRTRFRRDTEDTEAEIGLDDGASATVVVTGDLPDEARLALLDLDVTADVVRGKLLRWDGSASAWRPADD
jgi:hypothetical protein